MSSVFPYHLPPCFLRQDRSMNMDLTQIASYLARQHVPVIPVSVSQFWDGRCLLPSQGFTWTFWIKLKS